MPDREVDTTAVCISTLQTPDIELGTANCITAPTVEMEVALLTGGFDKPYVLGLSRALTSRNVHLEVIGSDHIDCPEMHTTANLNFLNLRGSKDEATLARKLRRVLIYYARLLRYASTAKPRLFHILWNNKFQFFDRTLLMLYYKLCGKKILFTAHNVNAGKRDSNDSWINRLTLRVQYKLADHIFVHTDKMMDELREDFGIMKSSISVVPFGINNSVPNTDLTPVEAKQKLGVRSCERTILFFGAIGPYKGLEYLVEAFQRLVATGVSYRLIIAGKPKEGCEEYWEGIDGLIERFGVGDKIITDIRYVSDEETELYFKAADVLALPYTAVFQSGVLFLAFNFGLPVVATDVGAINEDVINGRTGFLCAPCDVTSLANALAEFFESDLFCFLNDRRREIHDYANARHSWDEVGMTTAKVYLEVAQTRGARQSYS